uniref:SAM domain-containing protein n=2 Tax=Aegilops tauschii subsp. strangulata TaxID=200361 RepID=A0A453KUN8_AEGTS
TGGGICGISRSHSDCPKLFSTEKTGLGGYDGCNGSSNRFPNSTESSVLESGEACNLGSWHCEEAEGVSRVCNAVPEERLVGGISGSWLHGSVFDEGNVDIEAEIASRSETQKNERSGFEVHDGNYHSCSTESELLVLDSKYDIGGADCKYFQEPGLGISSLVSEERKVAVEDAATLSPQTREKKSSSAADCLEYQSSNSVESVLLESCTTHHAEQDDCDNFEIGTQLNELINLCMEDQVHSHRNSRASNVEGNKMDSGRFESVYKVQCPLCGSDISDLSEELQLAHTNNCLDEDEPAKESNPNHERGPCDGENIENTCVVEWLRKLGLSKYEEIFTKEEVDWETLQWLTEEDLLGMGITSLGPRKKIIHALGELRRKNDNANDTEADVLISENTKRTKGPMSGNKLITEFFRCSSSDQKQRDHKVQKPSTLNNQKNSSAKVASSRSRTRKAKVKDTPLWCCIPGTPFRVV